MRVSLWAFFQDLARHTHRNLSARVISVMAIGLLLLAPLLAPLAASAEETTGNWLLDDGSGHTLGAMFFMRSDINSASGLRLRLNAESTPMKLDHTHPLVLTDEDQQSWSLANLSEELLINKRGAIPAGSAQYDAGCLNPLPSDNLAMQIMVPSSVGNLSFDLSPGQVQTMHSLMSACAE